MRCEIINTGTELMLGRVLNTHQQWLCRRLADLGFLVQRQVAIPDSAAAIQEAMRETLARADLVIVTGGLGPTSDDRTRDLIAELLGRPLKEDAAVVAHIEKFFTALNRPMPASTRVQALIPAGATVLMNAHGTAPGLVLETGGKGGNGQALLILLPGPPRELRPMFNDQVVPVLRKLLPSPRAFVCRTLRCTGLGESLVEARIADPLRELVEGGLEVGYCARPGEVDVRLSASGPPAAERVAAAEKIARNALSDFVFGLDDETMESVVLRLLTERRQTLALAESCTGGLIAHRLTNIPGASAVFIAGLVTYSNQAKEQLLGVSSQTLSEHGAVSEATAREMAEGARRKSATDWAIAVTGIAGPDGGTAEKPVGTAWLAVAGPGGTVAKHRLNPYDRETFKEITAQQALDLLRRQLKENAHEPGTRGR